MIAEDKAAIAPGQGKGPTDAMSEAVPAMKPAAGTTGATDSTAAANDGVISPCTQADIGTMVTKAGTMTDKEKQKMTIGHLELAQKSMNQKDMDGCAMHMKAASASMGTITK